MLSKTTIYPCDVTAESEKYEPRNAGFFSLYFFLPEIWLSRSLFFNFVGVVVDGASCLGVDVEYATGSPLRFFSLKLKKKQINANCNFILTHLNKQPSSYFAENWKRLLIRYCRC